MQGVKNIKKKPQDEQKHELHTAILSQDEIFLKDKRLADYEQRKITFDKQTSEKRGKIVKQIKKEELNSLNIQSKQSNLHWMDRNDNYNYKIYRTKANKLPSIFSTNLPKPTPLSTLPPLTAINDDKIQSDQLDSNFLDKDILQDKYEDTMNNELLQSEYNDLLMARTSIQPVTEISRPPKQLISESAMQESICKLKRNIIRKQVVAGTEFVGQPFSSHPGEIIFKDFEVDTAYSKKVTLTNVSYSVNYCKFTHLSENLQDFCTVEFDPPGSLSAGLTCWFRVNFTPRLNFDLEGTINFLSQTGPFSIPLKCLSRKCVISHEKSSIDFGKICAGEKSSTRWLIRNLGVLPTEFKVTPLEINKDVVAVKNIKNDENINSESNCSMEFMKCDSNQTIISITNEGSLNSYGQAYIEFEFLPIQIGIFHQNFVINFSRDNVEPIELSLVGESIALPIFFERAQFDMKICVIGCLYQDSINIQNHSNNSQNVYFDIPKSLQEFITVLPIQGLVQGENKLNLQLQFTPNKDIWSGKNAKYLDRETNEFNASLNCRLKEHNLPLQFTLRARVTKAELKFNLSKINFGICHLQESVFIPIEVFNECLLSQNIGFIDLPNYISVSPNDGFLTLLPKETFILTLTFHPDKISDYDFNIKCKTQYNRNYSFSCTGKCIHSGLTLSHTEVCFAPTVIGDFSIANVELSNPKISRSSENTLRIFQFEVPPDVPIKISPLVGQIYPGQTSKIMLVFSPIIPTNEKINLSLELEKADILKSTESTGSKASPINNPNMNETSVKPPKSKSNKDNQHHAETSENSSQWEEAKSKLIKDFKGKTEFTRISCFVNLATPSPSIVKEETLYIDVTLKSLPPKLILRGLNGNFLRFGPCLTGMNVCRRLELENVSNSIVEFEHDILDTTGPFEILNIPRAIQPGKIFALIFNFSPRKEEEYLEEIRLRCSPHNDMPIRLIGSGIYAHIKLTDNSDAELVELIDFGDVIYNETSEYKVKLHNESSLPSSYKSHLSDSYKSLNLRGSNAFEVKSFKGVIGANSKQEMTILFKPDHVSLQYEDKIHIMINNNENVFVIQLKARVHDMNLYLEQDINSIYKRDLLIPPPKERYTEHCINLEHCGGRDSCPTRKVLRIGNIKHKSPGFKANGEFSFELDDPANSQKAFIIEPMKSMIEGGTIIDVTVSFDNKQVINDGTEVLAYYKLTLKGDTTKIHKLLLSGTLNQF